MDRPTFDLRTPRLRLAPFAHADGAALHALFTEAGVRRFLLDDAVVPRSWVDDEIAASDARFRAHGYGLWKAVAPPDTLIGFAGYRPFHDPPELELLYGLQPDWWGRGYATEAARAVVRYGFERVGFERIAASTDAPNVASIRVLQRLGMRFRERANKGGLDTIFYDLTRPDWERAAGLAGGKGLP